MVSKKNRMEYEMNFLGVIYEDMDIEMAMAMDIEISQEDNMEIEVNDDLMCD